MAKPQLPKVQFPWRAAIYGIAILYIAADLYLFRGPLSRMIDRMQGHDIEEQIAKVPTGLIATVNTRPISGADLDRRVWEYCTLRGLDPSTLDPQRLEIIRAVALSQLIDDLAIWHFSRLNPVPVEEAEIEAAYAEITARCGGVDALGEKLAAQQMDEKQFRTHVVDQLHQRKWLEAKAQSFISVSEQEARAWYEKDEASKTIPERWRASQVLIPAGEGAAEKIAQIASAIAAGETTFEQAKSQQESPETGEMGVFSSLRMPEEFITAIRSQPIGKTGEPFQTASGWHLVVVSEHLPGRLATFEEVEPEIRAYLEEQKRADVIDQIVRDLRKRSKIWPPQPRPRPILDPAKAN